MAQLNSTSIQSVIADKMEFKTPKSAHAWVAGHGFSDVNYDETEESYRFRQENPSKFKKASFRTIELRPGIKAIIGKKK